mmetsp:Transcript_641/g.1348  ORF Transcript_641/g.1348 Transcript_641/m.1348 type:complete len:297 (-) Transcript_641:134-1024(-)
MRILLSSVFALAIATASSAAAVGPSSRARSLATTALHKAASRAVREKERKLDELAGFDDMGDINALMCMFLPMITEDPEFDEALAAEGMSCDTFECDDAMENLIMSCSIPEEICDEEGESEFCAKDNTLDMTMGLNFEGTNNMSISTCSVYTAPDFMATGEQACFSTEVEMHMDKIMELGEDEEVEEALAANPEEFMSITKCAAEIGKDTCSCEVCDRGLGVTIKCANVGIVSEGCTDLDMSESAQLANGGTPGSDVSVMRFAQVANGGDDTSAAALPSAAAAGTFLVLASVVALM